MPEKYLYESDRWQDVYEERFGHPFPVMQADPETEDELIAMIKKCLAENKEYEISEHMRWLAKQPNIIVD